MTWEWMTESELEHAKRQVELEMENEPVEYGSWAFAVAILLFIGSGLAMIFGSIWLAEWIRKAVKL